MDAAHRLIPPPRYNDRPMTSLRRRALWGLLLAKAVAGIGVGWDIRWHVVIGRDSFWIAPHVMTYAGVAVAAVLSLGVLVWETWVASAVTRRTDAAGAGAGPVGVTPTLAVGKWRSRFPTKPGGATPTGPAPAPAASTLRIAGLVGTRGYHLAWWGIALTIIAAPIDDLWHRLFGIDVTLWSPPHLLGLAGAQLNSLACLLIAREVWPAGGRARTVALATGAVLFFSGFQTGIDPSLRTAFMHGGVRFFTYALLGSLFLTFSLVLVARLAGSRTMPVVVAVASVALQLIVIGVGDVGFAVLQPQPDVAEAIADPSSPIAVAHEIAKRNGTTPGRGFVVRLFPVLPALALALADPRRRPLTAGLAFGVGLFIVNAVMFMRSPAFAHVHPDPLDAIVALAATVVAAVLSAVAVLAFEARVIRGEPSARPVRTAVPVRPRV